MSKSEAYRIVDNKIILKIRDHIASTPKELVSESLFKDIVWRSIKDLKRRKSFLLDMFGTENIDDQQIEILYQTVKHLIKFEIEDVPKIYPESTTLIGNKDKLYDYIEFLYDYWRSYERIVICDSTNENYDQRPYRTFNVTIEQLTQVVRKTYRDIQENIWGDHPNVYRQVRAGAQLGTIALPMEVPMPPLYQKRLRDISIIRQVLINPPLVLDPPMNKRSGKFLKIDENPLNHIRLYRKEWLCYPTKVGKLTIMVYIHESFYDLGLSMANLFEIATDEDLTQKPDGYYFYGVPGGVLDNLGEFSTVFYDDVDNGTVVAACPNGDKFAYFGFLKKFILTIHNIQVMKQGLMPFHGSLTTLTFGGKQNLSVLIIGDSGAGKSETIEAFQNVAGDSVSDITVTADDMGSLDIAENGDIIGYGTEIGAFLRLDDLKPGAAFGNIDRGIFLNTGKVNARIIVPVTSLLKITRGTKVDVILYANNYDDVEPGQELITRFATKEEALKVFREGKAMRKGTTSEVGIVSTYFVNIFGPTSYVDLHDQLAEKYFAKFFEQGIFVGEMHTRLGVKGFERDGPEAVAREMFKRFKK